MAKADAAQQSKRMTLVPHEPDPIDWHNWKDIALRVIVPSTIAIALGAFMFYNLLKG